MGYFIDEQIFLDEIEESLENALDNSKDKKYFYNRKDYIDYLIQIYKIKSNEEKILKLLDKYKYDDNVCMFYVDELIKENRLNDAIKILKSNLNEDIYKSRRYAIKLSEIYYDNKMNDEYKNILYDLFYKYSNFNFSYYLKIKRLYSNSNWDKEKYIIIENIRKEKYANSVINDIFVEEKMYDDLYLNICNYDMDNIIKYEIYLLPKYNNSLLNIYKELCLKEAGISSGRKAYRNLAYKVNHMINMDNSYDVVKQLLDEMINVYFRNKPAMLDEFQDVIKDLNQYFAHNLID